MLGLERGILTLADNNTKAHRVGYIIDSKGKCTRYTLQGKHIPL